MTSLEIPRKSAQEVEIDRLLEEEFRCDPEFVVRFLAACGAAGTEFVVEDVAVEPSLGGEGFGDLLVTGRQGNARAALLIEDKITAGASPRQAERYAAQAARMRTEGWDEVLTVLVAPRGYRGERSQYDASVDLEAVAEVMTHCDPVRLAFRRGIIERALKKKATSGVKVPDAAVHDFKAAHLPALARLGAEAGLALTLPDLRPAYFDGDSWVAHIGEARLPEWAELRHRCWTPVRQEGHVDLILRRSDPGLSQVLEERKPDGAEVAPFSTAKGWQVSLPVPEMRPGAAYDEAAARAAVTAMEGLVRWFLALPPEVRSDQNPTF